MACQRATLGRSCSSSIWHSNEILYIALQLERPPHGLSEILASFPNVCMFDQILDRILVVAFSRAETQTRGLKLGSIFGPWEGGLASTGGSHPDIRVTPRRIACCNGQGAFACHNSVKRISEATQLWQPTGG